MRSFSINKKNILEASLFSLIGFLIITFNKISFCQQFYGLGFDQQAFLYWDYASSLGLTPFKDFFYPYGLLFYFKEINIHWYFISLALLLFISFVIFLTFKTIFKDRKYAYFFYLTFCLFVFAFVNLDTLLRYSPLLLFSSLISYLGYRKKLITNISGLVLGLTIGLFFSFINDIFFYSALIYMFFIVIYYLFNKKKINITLKQVLFHLLFILIGFLLGIIFLGLYLQRNNLFYDFIFYYSSFKDIFLLAKVPFPPSLRSLENVSVIIVLILSLFTLLCMVRKKTLDLKFYFLLSIILTIISLEQKNLVRSMYTQISFISFIPFLILLDGFRSHLKNKVSNQSIFLFIINLIFLTFLITGIDRNFNIEKNKYSFPEGSISLCMEEKINKIDPTKLSPYIKVKEYLGKDKNTKIFSFPGDPMFYILFNQKPPYYPSIYEATPPYAQRKLIEYIKDSNIDYVIYNKSSNSIQDEVPDIARAKLLYQYIVNNFEEEKMIDDFQILKKKSN